MGSKGSRVYLRGITWALVGLFNWVYRFKGVFIIRPHPMAYNIVLQRVSIQDKWTNYQQRLIGAYSCLLKQEKEIRRRNWRRNLLLTLSFSSFILVFISVVIPFPLITNQLLLCGLWPPCRLFLFFCFNWIIVYLLG